MEIVIDQEFKALIPPLAEEEHKQLEANIVQDGCRDPLVVWRPLSWKPEGCDKNLSWDEPDDSFTGEDGELHKTWFFDDEDGLSDEVTNCDWPAVLVDGHNRYEICRRLGIHFDTVEKEFADRTAAVLWMIDNQFGRRNVADIDRIALARKREEVLRPLAKESKSEKVAASNKRRSGIPIERNFAPNEKLKTSKEAAKTAGVGERTYDAGKLILDAKEKGEIEPEVIEKLRRKETSIHRVAKDIKEKRQAEKRQTKRKEAAAKVEPKFFHNVHVGDFRDHFDKVADGSLSLIFTDPPYDKKAEELFEGLAEFAAAKLADGGSLVMYLGHLQLRSALNAFDGKLRHWWTCACFHDGGKTLMREYGIRVGWKPMLWFVKGTRDDKQHIVSDVVSGQTEKSHHDWQQSQHEAEYWIENLCPPDGIVCDPFLGGGTTAAAAIKLNRQWIGFEINQDQAVLAMSRCCND